MLSILALLLALACACSHATPSIFDAGSTGIKVTNDDKVVALEKSSNPDPKVCDAMSGLHELVGATPEKYRVAKCNFKTKAVVEEVAPYTDSKEVKLAKAGAAVLKHASNKAAKVHIYATAGMRQFAEATKPNHEGFWTKFCEAKHEDKSSGKSVFVEFEKTYCTTIHGVDEAKFEFIAVNNEADGFKAAPNNVGTITMGGSSLQVTIPLVDSDGDKAIAKSFVELVITQVKDLMKNTAPFNDQPIKLYANLWVKPTSTWCSDETLKHWCAPDPGFVKNIKDTTQAVILISFLAVEKRSLINSGFDKDHISLKKMNPHVVGGSQYFGKIAVQDLKRLPGCGEQLDLIALWSMADSVLDFASKTWRRSSSKYFDVRTCYASVGALMLSDPLYAAFHAFWITNSIYKRNFDVGTRAADVSEALKYAAEQAEKKFKITIKDKEAAVDMTSLSTICEGLYNQITTVDSLAKTVCDKYLSNGVTEPEDFHCMAMMFDISFFHQLYCFQKSAQTDSVTFTTKGITGNLGWFKGAALYLA